LTLTPHLPRTPKGGENLYSLRPKLYSTHRTTRMFACWQKMLAISLPPSACGEATLILGSSFTRNVSPPICRWIQHWLLPHCLHLMRPDTQVLMVCTVPQHRKNQPASFCNSSSLLGVTNFSNSVLKYWCFSCVVFVKFYTSII